MKPSRIRGKLNVQFLGNRNPKYSKLGAVDVNGDEFYDYNNKFVDASGVVFKIPVDLPEKLTKKSKKCQLRHLKPWITVV